MRKIPKMESLNGLQTEINKPDCISEEKPNHIKRGKKEVLNTVSWLYTSREGRKRAIKLPHSS